MQRASPQGEALCFGEAELLGEGRYSRCFVVFDVENGVELGNLQQIVNLFGEVQKLEVATLVANRREGAD